MNDDTTDFPSRVLGFLVTSGLFFQLAENLTDHETANRSNPLDAFGPSNFDSSLAIQPDSSTGDLRMAFSTDQPSSAHSAPLLASETPEASNRTDITEASTPTFPRSLPEAGPTR